MELETLTIASTAKLRETLVREQQFCTELVQLLLALFHLNWCCFQKEKKTRSRRRTDDVLHMHAAQDNTKYSTS